MIDIMRRTLVLAAGLAAARPILRISLAVAAEIDPTARLGYP
jgi:hypothetical protein